MSAFRVLIVDDYPLIRTGLCAFLDSSPEFQVVGESTTGPDALRRVDALRPDVVVMDAPASGGDSAGVIAEIKRRRPSTQVLMLSRREDSGSYFRALSAGAAGYVLKSVLPDELVRALKAVCQGRRYIDPLLARLMIDQIAYAEAPVRLEGQPALTVRETEVLRYIALGHTNKDLAAILGVSVKTVEAHRRRAMEKLGLGSRVELVRLAIRSGWMRDDPTQNGKF